jgi:hypothetical protein
MGKMTQVIDTLFKGNRNPFNRIMTNTPGVATSPNGVKTAPKGTLFVMTSSGTAESDDDIYINMDGSTTWTLIYDASTYGHIY